jgi:hypothetical protein
MFSGSVAGIVFKNSTKNNDLQTRLAGLASGCSTGLVSTLHEIDAGTASIRLGAAVFAAKAPDSRDVHQRRGLQGQ